MFLTIQNGLVQMGNAPALRNIEGKFLRQLICRFTCDIVPPGAEGRQLLAVLVKGQVAVHHGTDADGTNLRQGHMIATLDIRCQLLKAGLNSLPGFRHFISPDAVHQLVFPFKTGSCQRFTVLVHEHGLDACGTQLHPQCRSTAFNASRIFYQVHNQ